MLSCLPDTEDSVPKCMRSVSCDVSRVQRAGASAKNQTTQNPEHTLFDAKRIIDRKFADPVVQSNMKLWSFKVPSGCLGQADPGTGHARGEKIHPEEVSSHQDQGGCRGVSENHG